VFGVHHWVEEATAAAEISEAFRANEPIPGLGAEHREALEAIIAPCFLKGDVLLSIQCTLLEMLPDHQQVACLARAAKMIDSVSNVWSQYDDMGETSLGAVVVRGRPHIRMDTPSAPAPTRLTVAAPS